MGWLHRWFLLTEPCGTMRSWIPTERLVPRRRPGRVPAELRRRHRPPISPPFIPDLSSAARAEVARIELRRKYLWPGATWEAAVVWSRFVRNPHRQLWAQDDPSDCDTWLCCGSPFEARHFLEAVVRGMSRERRPELRRIVDELDDQFD